MSELRWHPLRREWVVTATHRQDRTFLPPPDYCPLCPTQPGGFPTEIPEATYQIVVFENRFPSLSCQPPEPAVAGNALHPVRPAQGVCEVVVYTPEHGSSLTERTVEEIYQLVQVWTDRYQELGAQEAIEYVLIFENRGEAIGVTLHHPHGQIYAFPFVPSIPQLEMEAAREHRLRTGRCLLCDIVDDELADGRRVVAENQHFAAYVPCFARYPYEVHVISKAHRPALPELSDPEAYSLAELLKIVLVKYDKLFGFRLPYLMIMHQAPTKGDCEGLCHFHIEFYPPHRSAQKLKYLAGCEQGGGMFINDTLPEEKAAELRALEVTL